VYNALGYGFLEHVCSNALSLELRNRGLHVAREVAVEVQYQGQSVGNFRMDMVVERRAIIEIKSCATVGLGEQRQLHNYLKAAKLPVGLLLHFGPNPDFRRLVGEQSPCDRDPSAVSASSVSSV
jgi:GxxExxY protein